MKIFFVYYSRVHLWRVNIERWLRPIGLIQKHPNAVERSMLCTALISEQKSHYKGRRPPLPQPCVPNNREVRQPRCGSMLKKGDKFHGMRCHEHRFREQKVLFMFTLVHVMVSLVIVLF